MTDEQGAATAAELDLSQGSVRAEILVENLTRTQIVMYAGASGDFSPIHTDEVYATEVAGYRSTFAHGMLTMALTGRMLTTWLGAGSLRKFGGRFLNQVWPGDSLTGTAEIIDVRTVDDGSLLVDLEVSTVNQDGVEVFRASATARPQRGHAPEA